MSGVYPELDSGPHSVKQITIYRKNDTLTLDIARYYIFEQKLSTAFKYCSYFCTHMINQVDLVKDKNEVVRVIADVYRQFFRLSLMSLMSNYGFLDTFKILNNIENLAFNNLIKHIEQYEGFAKKYNVDYRKENISSIKRIIKRVKKQNLLAITVKKEFSVFLDGLSETINLHNKEKYFEYLNRYSPSKDDRVINLFVQDLYSNFIPCSNASITLKIKELKFKFFPSDKPNEEYQIHIIHEVATKDKLTSEDLSKKCSFEEVFKDSFIFKESKIDFGSYMRVIHIDTY